MRIIKGIGGVVTGYVVFAVSAVLLFRLTGRNPHAMQDTAFVILSIVYGMFFAGLSGYVSAAIGAGRRFLQSGAVGLLIAIGAAASLFTAPGGDAKWSMVAALTLMAPSAVIGGAFRHRVRESRDVRQA